MDAIIQGFANRFAFFHARTGALLGLPENVLLDPLRATEPETGRPIDESAARLLDTLRTDAHLRINASVTALLLPRLTSTKGCLDRQELKAFHDCLTRLVSALENRN